MWKCVQKITTPKFTSVKLLLWSLRENNSLSFFSSGQIPWSLHSAETGCVCLCLRGPFEVYWHWDNSSGFVWYQQILYRNLWTKRQTKNFGTKKLYCYNSWKSLKIIAKCSLYVSLGKTEFIKIITCSLELRNSQGELF